MVLDPSRYRKLGVNFRYGTSDGIYYDATDNTLVLALGDSVVSVVTSSGSTADLELSNEARGDILRRGASAWERHPASTTGQILVGDGTDIVSVQVYGDATMAGDGALTVTDVTVGSDAQGDLLYKSSATLLARLPKGTAGQVLAMNAGATAPQWTEVGSSLQAKPRLRVIQETLTAATLTDGGAAVGTKNLTAAIPAGARFLYATIHAITGFAEDTSATITLGDGSTADRYNTGTPSIFTTAAAGVDLGAPSGTAWHTAAVANIVATVTSAADITPVIAGAGSCVLTFWFLEPV